MKVLVPLCLLAFLVLALVWGRAGGGRAPAPSREEPPSPASAERAADLAGPGDAGSARTGEGAGAADASAPAPRGEPAGSERASRALRLTGRVVDELGAPVAGARVLAAATELCGTGPQLLGVSGGDGTIDEPLAPDELLCLPRTASGPTPISAELRLDVLAAGFSRASREVLLSGEVIHLGEIVLEPGAVVVGRAFGADGVPVPGADVAWYAEEDASLAEFAHELGLVARTGYAFVPTTKVDTAGAFRVEGVPARRGFLAGRGASTSFGRSEPFDAPRGGVVEVDLVLPPRVPEHEIAGVVLLPDGSPAARAIVGDSTETSSRAHSERSADDEGRFRIPAAGSGPRRVGAREPTGRAYPVEVADVAPGTLDLVLRLGEPRWLEVAVTDPAGAPIAGSSVRGAELATGLFPAIPLTQADASGVVTLLRPRQPFQLQGFAPGFRPSFFGPFDPGELGARLTLSLQPGQAVQGTVTHLGKPVAGARVTVSVTPAPGFVGRSRNAAPLDQPFAILGTAELRTDATTDADGAFVATLPSDGWHLLRVVAEGFPATTFGPFEWTKADGAHGLVLELARGGAIEGRVLAPEGDVAGRLVGASNGWGIVVATSADATGRFHLANLAPGDWQVRPCAPPLASEQRLKLEPSPYADPTDVVWDCRVRAGETTVYDLDLSDHEAFVLEGELTTVWEVEGWTAVLQTLDEAGVEGAVAGRATLDGRGRFRIVLSRGGPFRLRLDGLHGTLMQDVAVERGENDWSAALPVARLQLSGAPPLSRAGAPLRIVLYVWEGPGGLRFERPVFLLHLGSGEQALVVDVPAGPGRLVERPQAQSPGQVDPREDRTLRDLDAPAGEELEVQLP